MKVEPSTFQERVKAKLQDWLKNAGHARAQSLTLQSLEFAEELAQKLMGHALSMERTYLRIQNKMKDTNLNEKDFKSIYAVMEEKIAIYDKLQARPDLEVEWARSQLNTGYAIDTC